MVRPRSVIDDTIDSDEEQHHKEHLQDREGIEKAVMAAAKLWSNVLLDENGMCSVYCNEQVQFENTSSSFTDEDDVSQSARSSGAQHSRQNSFYQYNMESDEERFEKDKDYRLLSFSESSQATRSSVRSLFQRLDNCNSSSNINPDAGNTSLAEEQIQRYRNTLFDEDTLVDTLHNRMH